MYDDNKALQLEEENRARREEANASASIVPQQLSEPTQTALAQQGVANQQMKSEGVQPTIDNLPAEVQPANPIEDKYVASGAKAEDDAKVKENTDRKIGVTVGSKATIPDDVDWTNQKQREKFLLKAKEMGVPLQQIKDAVGDKWGDEPIENTIIRLAREYKGDPLVVLKDFGVDIDDLENETSGLLRYAKGVRLTFLEAFDGMGIETTNANGYTIQEEIGRQKKFESIYQTLSGELDSNGEHTRGKNIAGGVGEALPYLATGIATGMAQAPIMAQLITDFAISQGIDTTRMMSDKDMEKYGWNTAANAFGFGLGKVLSKSEIDTLAEATKGINTLGEGKAAAILNGIAEAEKAGIDLLSSDINSATKLAHVIATLEKSPITAGKLMDLTKHDVEKVTKYLDIVMEKLAKESATDIGTARVIADSLRAQTRQYDDAIEIAYKNLGVAQDAHSGTMSNDTVVSWLNKVIADNNNLKITHDVTGKNTIDSYMSSLLKTYSTNGKELGVQDMYSIMRSIIGEASQSAKKGDLIESKAFARLADRFSKQFHNMTGGDSTLDELALGARKAYLDKLDLFGKGSTGKGAELEGFIPKFLNKVEVDVNSAAKMLDTAEKVAVIRRAVGDKTMDIIKRNKLQTVLEAKDIKTAAKELDKYSDSFLRELYGDEGANTIRGLAKLMEWVGERQHRLSQPNILGVMGTIKGLSFGSIFETAGKLLRGVMEGRGAVKASQAELKSLKTSLTKKLNGKTIEELMKGINDLGIRGDYRVSAEDILGDSTNKPTVEMVEKSITNNAEQLAREEANRVQGTVKELKVKRTEQSKAINDAMKTKFVPTELKEQLADAQKLLTDSQNADDVAGMNEGMTLLDDVYRQVNDMPTKAEVRIADKAKTALTKEQTTRVTEVQRKQTNLTTEIRAGFKTRVLEVDDRLNLARIQEDIVRARNKGDVEATEEAVMQLENFRNYVANKPKRATRAEFKDAKDRAREDARQANRARELRLQRQERARQEIIANQSQGATPKEAFTLTRPEQVTQAGEGVVSRLNNSQGSDGWRITHQDSRGMTFAGTVEKNGEQVESSFSVSLYGDSMSAITTRLVSGSGGGSSVYHSIFDMAQELGAVYTPSSSLYTANPTRMTVNMLSYMESRVAKGLGDAPWVHLGASQVGVTRATAGLPLTKVNANKMLKNLVKTINNDMLVGVRLTGTTSDEMIDKMARTDEFSQRYAEGAYRGDRQNGVYSLGGNNYVRFGSNTLKKIRGWIKEGGL